MWGDGCAPPEMDGWSRLCRCRCGYLHVRAPVYRYTVDGTDYIRTEESVEVHCEGAGEIRKGQTVELRYAPVRSVF